MLTGLLNKENSQNTSINKATNPIIPENTGNSSWEKEAHDKDNLDIVAVLPYDDGVLVEVRNIGTSNTLWVFY